MSVSTLPLANRVIRQFGSYADVDMQWPDKDAFQAEINNPRIPDGWLAFCVAEKTWYQADKASSMVIPIGQQIDVENEITENSTNPVTGAAIFNYLQNYVSSEELENILSSNAKQLTHAQALAAANANQLEIFSFYTITDFQTIHMILETAIGDPDYINTGGIEQLTILAIANNKFAPVAYSFTNPNDFINYDITDVTCEDGITPRKGRIIYRRNEKQYISARYDYLTVKFRRFYLNPNAYDAATTYNFHNHAELGGIIYVCLVNGTVGIEPSHASPNWSRLYDMNGTDRLGRYVATTKTNFKVGDRVIPVDATKFRDYHTFSTLIDNDFNGALYLNPNDVFDNIIGKPRIGNNYNNIIIVTRYNNARKSINHINTGSYSEKWTFTHFVQGLEIEGYANNNLSGDYTEGLRMGEYCGNNMFQGFVRALICNNAMAHNNFAGVIDFSWFYSFFHRTTVKGNIVEVNTGAYNTGGNIFQSIRNSKIPHQMINCRFAGDILNDTSFNCFLNGKTFTNSLNNIRVTSVSANGTVWGETTLDTGATKTTKVL